MLKILLFNFPIEKENKLNWTVIWIKKFVAKILTLNTRVNWNVIYLRNNLNSGNIVQDGRDPDRYHSILTAAVTPSSSHLLTR